MTDVLLDDLRERFKDVSRQRVEAMAVLLAALDRDPTDASALKELAKHFHALAGHGGTYGFPRISTLADEGEGSSAPLARQQSAPAADLVARWQELVSEIARELSADRAPAVGSIPLRGSSTLFEVLLVEDDEDLAAIVAHSVEEGGFAVRICAGRDEALDAIGKRIPDAMIVDVVLPDGSGYDVVEALREAPGGEGVGTIVVSASHGFVDKVRAIRSGADAFVGKPLDLPALVRRLGAFRDRKEHAPHRILAVEDDATQILLLRRVLGAAGYDVAICSDPEAFEETLLAFGPDLVLMDVQFADHDVSGYDLVRYVRQNDRYATLPIIFVTSAAERDALIHSTESGGDTLVPKPVDWHLLLSQIESRLERAVVARDLAERDALTGMLTRRPFEARARQRLESDRRASDRPAVLVLIDLDHFKRINDTFGHAAGDRVLASLSVLLRRTLRQGDLVGRWGGEEFALLLDDLSVDDAVHLTERLIEDLAALDHDGMGHVTFSAGVTPLSDSLESSFARADAALYEAKRSGRSRVVRA
jgi:diguanylate cyclase (GGDEF)-like protein